MYGRVFTWVESVLMLTSGGFVQEELPVDVESFQG